MNTIKLDDQNFQEEVVDYKGIVLVDFWAPWCGPCQVMGPIIDDLARQYGDKIKIGKLNVDESPKTAASFQIMSIPTLIIFKSGKVVDQTVGVQAKETLELKIDPLLFREK